MDTGSRLKLPSLEALSMLKLYTSIVCPFAHRSRLAAAAKQAACERVEISLNPMPDWYKQFCPTASVPLLETEHGLIWESLIINEYLNETLPGAALWPADAYLKARGKIAIETAGSQFVGVFYRLLKGDLEATRENLEPVLQALETSMVGDGPFWLGAEPSLTDIAIYPWFERWSALEHYRSLPLNLSGRLQTWFDTFSALDWVKAEVGPKQLYIDGYSRYVPASVAS